MFEEAIKIPVKAKFYYTELHANFDMIYLTQSISYDLLNECVENKVTGPVQTYHKSR